MNEIEVTSFEIPKFAHVPPAQWFPSDRWYVWTDHLNQTKSVRFSEDVLSSGRWVHFAMMHLGPTCWELEWEWSETLRSRHGGDLQSMFCARGDSILWYVKIPVPNVWLLRNGRVILNRTVANMPRSIFALHPQSSSEIWASSCWWATQTENQIEVWDEQRQLVSRFEAVTDDREWSFRWGPSSTGLIFFIQDPILIAQIYPRKLALTHYDVRGRIFSPVETPRWKPEAKVDGLDCEFSRSGRLRCVLIGHRRQLFQWNAAENAFCARFTVKDPTPAWTTQFNEAFLWMPSIGKIRGINSAEEIEVTRDVQLATEEGRGRDLWGFKKTRTGDTVTIRYRSIPPTLLQLATDAIARACLAIIDHAPWKAYFLKSVQRNMDP